MVIAPLMHLLHCQPFASANMLSAGLQDFLPHVQATLMATDTIGLEVLQNATWHEAKMKGEIAASSAILDAGYNLDCFNPPYQGVNWRDKRAWPCAKTVRQHPQEAAADAFSTHVEVSLQLIQLYAVPTVA